VCSKPPRFCAWSTPSSSGWWRPPLAACARQRHRQVFWSWCHPRIATLKHEIAGLIAVNPEGGKIARAAAVSPQIESGNVYLPHPAIAPWVEDLIEECAAFPYASHDDQVDALTQALNRLHDVSRKIYTVQESEIAIDPIPIPAHWPCVFGMDARPNETAALWGAFDPAADILYV
jgi:hypothetical protein